jgi:hypothetical protein
VVFQTTSVSRKSIRSIDWGGLPNPIVGTIIVMVMAKEVSVLVGLMLRLYSGDSYTFGSWLGGRTPKRLK